MLLLNISLLWPQKLIFIRFNNAETTRQKRLLCSILVISIFNTRLYWFKVVFSAELNLTVSSMKFYNSCITHRIWKANQHFYVECRLGQCNMTNMGLTEIWHATNVVVLITVKFTSFTILFIYKRFMVNNHGLLEFANQKPLASVFTSFKARH